MVAFGVTRDIGKLAHSNLPAILLIATEAHRRDFRRRACLTSSMLTR